VKVNNSTIINRSPSLTEHKRKCWKLWS